MFELGPEDEKESSGWSWVGTEQPIGMFMSNRHKNSRVGKDSVAEQLEEGGDAAV